MSIGFDDRKLDFISIEDIQKMHTLGGENFAIFAQSIDGVIGADNDLLWYLSEDLSFFKNVTLNNNIIMGKNTWLSLPHKPLPKRNNIVVSSSLDNVEQSTIVVNSIDKSTNVMRNNGYNFFIGGSQIYNYVLEKNIVDGVYVTIVDFVDTNSEFSHIENVKNTETIVYAPSLSKNYVLCAETDWIVSKNGYIKHDKEKNKIKYKVMFYRKNRYIKYNIDINNIYHYHKVSPN